MTALASHEVEQFVARQTAADRVAATNDTADRFFHEQAERIAHACQVMAERFEGGGRLLVCGDGAQRSDVAHVVVEFVHPVVVGKRALPALPLPAMHDGAALLALATLGRSGDLLMMLSAGAPSSAGRSMVASARQRGLLTIALVGGGEASSGADHDFCVSSDDACIVQETHEMLYHVLWELVHVFLEHRAVNE